MGYAVFWVETLAVALLLIAAVAACTARWPRRFGPRAVPVLTAVLLLGLAGAAVRVFGYFEFDARFDLHAFYPMLGWTLLYLVGVIAVLHRGLRRADGVSAAQAWPRGRLALCLAAAVILATITFTNLDLAVRVRMAGVRAEAGARTLAGAPPQVLDRDNAAPIYREAFDALTPANKLPDAVKEKLAAWSEPNENGLDLKDPDLRDYLAGEQRALALFRRAAGMPGCRFDWDFTKGIELLLPELDQLPRGAVLLALDARVCAGRGDTHAAMDDLAAIFSIANHIDDPILISMLRAGAIEDVGIRALEAVLAHAPPGAEDIARTRLPGENAYRTKMQRAFRMEEAALGLSTFVLLTEGGSPEWDQAFDGLSGGGRLALGSPIYRVFFLESDLAAYRRTMSAMRGLVGRPYYEAHAEWAEFDRSFRARKPGILTFLIVPAGYKCALRAAELDAGCQLARIALAAVAYRGKTGKYPDTLADLVPAYLPRVPADPFDGQPLRSKRDGNGLVLYSIGANLRDDGGGVALGPDGKAADIVFRLR